MDKSNSKILTVSFSVAAAIIGFTVSLLMRAFSGAFGFVARITDSDLVRHGFPVFLGLTLFLIMQFHPRVLAWGDDVVSEIRKVVWPTRKDTTAMIIAVVMMVIISSVIVSVFDFTAGFFVSKLMQ